jgi:transposase
MPVYEAIRQFVLKHTVIGADETGVNINGKNHWAWAFQNQRATYIAVHKSRGSAAIKEIMPEGFDRNILVTDCWAAYFKAGALSHQLCTAHLLRELKYLNQRYPENTWVTRVSGLIENAIEMRAQGELTPEKVSEVHRTFWHLVKEPATDKDINELTKFQKRMVKYQEYVFGFLDNPELVPDNNGSERAVRNFKAKQKVSGFFKSNNGPQVYSTLRSIIDTAIKNEQNPYLVLQQLAYIC